MGNPTTRAIMVDGRMVDGPAALIELDDGLVRGDGVFEGMRLYDRAPRTFNAHLERLALSARNVALALDLDQLCEEMARFALATSEPDCGVRLMVTRGGHRIWREEPVPPASAGLRLRPARHRVSPLLIGAKTLSYAPNMQAQRQAHAAGCDDALFVRADDDVILEGPTTAFAWIEGDTLVFPPLEAGVLDSITRRIACDALPSRTREATLGELADADGAILMSTVIEAQPVAEVLDVARFDPASAVVARMTAAITEASRAACAPVGATA
jgi:branched-subunit amino acid aminotransferase/4-amino-4-deoxychorismate lyase